MLKYIQVTNRANYCETRVRHIAKSLVALCSLLDSFESSFKNEIEAIQRVNTSHCSDWYKLIRTDNKITIWHLDMHAEMDRAVAEIIEVNKKDIYEGVFNLQP